jgi:acyl-CoA dehydrogenase
VSALARARRVATEIAAAHAEAVDREGRFPHEAMAALRAERLLGAMVPVELGGEGAGLGEIAEMAHALGRHCGSTAMVFAMHQIQVACLLRHGRGSPFHARLLARLAAEQLLLASATSEAGVGGDVRASVCAVEAAGERLRLAKNAIVISYGEQADGVLATARRAPDAPPGDQVLIVALRPDYRLERTSGWDAMGMRGTCSDGFWLHVDAPADRLLPEPYVDISERTMLPVTHILWSALWAGIAADAVGRARAFLRAAARRRPGETPPGASRLVEAVSALQAVRATILDAARRWEAAAATGPPPMALALALNNLKTWTSRHCLRAAEQALLVTGIAGYRNDGPWSVARPLRDLLSAQVMINNDRIAAHSASLLLAVKDEPEPLA